MTVTVYTQPLCRPCDRVKNKLLAAGIDFEEVDILQDDKAYSFLKYTLGAQSTPVVIGPEGWTIVGYQPDKLKDLIDALRD